MNCKNVKDKIFEMLDAGMSNKAIADALGVCRNTVSTAKQEWKNLPKTTTSERLQKRSYSQIDIAERLGMSLKFVGITIYEGFPVYTLYDGHTFGFEDTYIVCCPGTTEKYDEKIFGDVAFTLEWRDIHKKEMGI